MSNQDDRLWAYNCLDCVYTRECGEVEMESLKKMGLVEQDAFQQKMFWPVLEAMKRGVRIDLVARAALAKELAAEIALIEAWFVRVLGHPLNPKSPLQMSKLLYEDFKQPAIRLPSKGGYPGGLTTKDEALRKIVYREPLLRPLLSKVAYYRSLGVILSTFVNATLDIDDRMRCSYNICGTESFRLNSGENAFGTGTNLQNVPIGGTEDEEDILLAGVTFPNVRKIFVPDPEHTMFDTDLSKADLTIVAWESDCKDLKIMLKEGRDPYIETAREYYRDPTIVKMREDGTLHPKYDQFKRFGHGTNYLGTPQGLAGRIGLSVHECERAQKWYFGKYPEIKAWHRDRIEHIKSKRYVQNVFGNRRYYFDRIDDSTFREAIAWIPQSTVALYINRIWLNLWDGYRWIWVLLQVHDSLVGQFPTFRKAEALAAIKACSAIELPYLNDPLVIKLGVKTSEVSWGDCK